MKTGGFHKSYPIVLCPVWKLKEASWVQITSTGRQGNVPGHFSSILQRCFTCLLVILLLLAGLVPENIVGGLMPFPFVLGVRVCPHILFNLCMKPLGAGLQLSRLLFISPEPEESV